MGESIQWGYDGMPANPERKDECDHLGRQKCALFWQLSILRASCAQRLEKEGSIRERVTRVKVWVVSLRLWSRIDRHDSRGV